VRERMIRMRVGGSDTLARLQDHPVVRASGGKERTTKEEEIHYDTDRMDLHRRGLALKVRREGKKWVQEIVPLAAGNPLARKGGRAWRCRVAGQSLDLKKIKKAKAARQLLGRIRVGQLRPVFRVNVDRHAWRLGFPDGTRLLLAIERADLASEETKSHFDDLVLEYMDGDPVWLHQTGLTLAYALKALLTCGLPVERWMVRRIPELLAIPPVKPLRVEGGASGEQGFVGIMEQLLERMRKGHCAALQGSGSVRTQGIFALYRAASELRALVALYDIVLPSEIRNELDGEFQWLLGELETAVQWEAFLGDTLESFMAHFAGHPGMEALRRSAAESRRAARDAMVSQIDDFRFTRLHLGLTNWLVAKAWNDLMDLPQRRQMGHQATSLAKVSLARYHRQVTKLGGELPDLEREPLERLLSEGTMLLEGGRFFAALFGGKGARDFQGDLETLHGLLTALLDVERGRERFAEISPGQQDPIRYLFQGWLGAREEAFVEEVAAAWESFSHRPPYWQ